MLDCHIIVRHDTRPEWLSQCRGSVRLAAEHAWFPVRVYEVDAVPGHIGQARARGYGMGTSAYVTYVDDDDYVLPSAFNAMAQALTHCPDALFMAEQQWQNDHLCAGPQRHHLCVYRREHLIDHTQWTVCGDLAQMNAVADKHCIDVADQVYIHRLYQSGGRQLRRQHHDELRNARG